MISGQCPGVNPLEFKQQVHYYAHSVAMPFMPMEMNYDWHFGVPGKRLAVNMQNFQQGARVFDATLDLTRQEISAGSLARALVAFPLMTVTVIAGIYVQALKLWLKRIPIHAHPSRTAPHADDVASES